MRLQPRKVAHDLSKVREVLERSSPDGQFSLESLAAVLGRNTQVTQEWTSDSGDGHILVMSTSDTHVVAGRALWNLTTHVYTEELSGLKIKSRGNFQLGWGRAKGNYQEKEIVFSNQCYQRYSLSQR